MLQSEIEIQRFACETDHIKRSLARGGIVDSRTELRELPHLARALPNPVRELPVLFRELPESSRATSGLCVDVPNRPSDV